MITNPIALRYVYDEKTMVDPYNGMEVYGDGNYWYTYAKEIADEPELWAKFRKTPSQNPLFVILGGCTISKLHARGFVLCRPDG